MYNVPGGNYYLPPSENWRGRAQRVELFGTQTERARPPVYQQHPIYQQGYHQPSVPQFRVGPLSSNNQPTSHGFAYTAPPPEPVQSAFHGYQGHHNYPIYHNQMSHGHSTHSHERRFPPAMKRRKTSFSFFCETCVKGFELEEDFDVHVAEDHVTCSHPGCGFNAREDVVRAHKVKHAVNTESEEEIASWIAMRRFKFPRKDISTKPAEEPQKISKLEQFIRGSIRQAKLEARKRRLEREQKKPCIHWERTGKCRFAETCSFAHEKHGVCTFFVNHGRCRHGDSCKYKHVRASSNELEELRNPHGGLLKKLLSVETTQFENRILQVLRHAVNNNFYQGGEGAVPAAEESDEDLQSEYSEDRDSISENDEIETGDLSPLSTA
jgi:hypothetical protein